MALTLPGSRFLGIDLPLIAAELEMHRTGRARGRDAKRLAQHVGKARDIIDAGVELGHRLECRQIIDLLIDLSELGLRLAAAGHCDHRRSRITYQSAGDKVTPNDARHPEVRARMARCRSA